MKKILILAKSFGGGGTETTLIELLNHLDYKRYQVTLLLLDQDDEYRYRLKVSHPNLLIQYMDFSSSYFHNLASMYHLWGKAVKRLRVNYYLPIYEWLSTKVNNPLEAEYDLAIDFYGYGAFLTTFLTEKVRAKKKYTWLHSTDIGWLKNVIRSLRKVDGVIGVSKACIGSFDHFYPKYQKEKKVIYNLLDKKRVIQMSEEGMELIREGSAYQLLTIGRLDYKKGLDILVETARILNSRDFSFCWYVIGEGSYEKVIKALCQKYHLEDKVIFLGRKDNPYPYFKFCDLYVQPSRVEGYATTLVEARVLNTLILSSGIDASREQIMDEINGYLEGLDPIKMADKIEAISKNDKKNQRVIDYLESHPIDFSKEIDKIYGLMDEKERS